MPGWEPVVSLILSGGAVILLVLVMVNHRESRPMKLSLYCLLVASSVFRLIRAWMTGGPTSWIDGLALVFFGYAAIAEAIPLIRSRYKRGGR